MAVETTTTLSNNLHSYYHKRLLVSAEKALRLRPLGMDAMHPKGTGTQSFMLKYGHVAASTSTLSEGTPPSETTIDTNKYTITINQYGQFIKLSDFLITTAIDPVLKSVSDKLGYCAALSMDQVIRDHLIANATNDVQYSAAHTADDDITAIADGVLVTKDVLKGVRLFKGADAPMFDDETYRWIVHPYQAIDIQNDTAAGGFIELNKYVAGLADKPLKGEVGKCYGARVVESSNMTSAENSSTINIYRSLLLAKDAFATTKFDKNLIELIVKQTGTAGTADPLNQLATVGYKMQFGVKYVGGSFSNHNGASPDLCIQIRSSATGG